MPTMLDERPAPRKPILFGRALVQQQIADQNSAEKARDDVRMEAAQKEVERHNLSTERLDILKANNAVKAANAKLILEEAKVTKDGKQLDAFVRAQKAVGALKANDPAIHEKIAQIQADHAILFSDNQNAMTMALGKQVSELFSERKAKEVADAKKAEIVAKAGERTLRMEEARANGLEMTRDTVGGTVMAAPDTKTPGALTDKDRLDVFKHAYETATKERGGIIGTGPGTYKDAKGNAITDDIVTMLDKRRTVAMGELSKLGLNVEGDAPAAAEASPSTPAVPKPGDVRDGHRFKGGDPGSKTNWEPMQ